MKPLQNINLYHCLLLAIAFLSMDMLGQNEPSMQIEKFQSPATPEDHYSPRVTYGSQQTSALPTIKIVFDLYYDSMANPQAYNIEGTWFNPDGKAVANIEDFPAEKRRRVSLVRSDGIPKSGYGKLFDDGGLGIIDVVEVRRRNVQLAEAVSGAELQVFPSIPDQVCTFQTFETVKEALLVDIKGNIIWRQQLLQPGMHSLATETLEAGIYFLRLNYEGYSQTKKICVFHQ